jgi:hypothetical protein
LNLDLSASTFTSQVNAALMELRTSNTIVVGGIANGSAISVTGGEYRIDAGAFTGNAGTINAGQSVTLRMTASSSCATTTSVTVTIASVARSFSVTTIPCDTTPDALQLFVPQAFAEPGSVRTSNTITVTGINAPIPISVVGGSYSIGCTASFTTAPGTIANNGTVCVRQTASMSENTLTSATLTVGPFSQPFDVMTRVGAAFSVTPMVTTGPFGISIGVRSDGTVFEWKVGAQGGYTGAALTGQHPYLSGVRTPFRCWRSCPVPS